MSEINDQLSDVDSDINWPIEAVLEGHQHDRVIFENVPDQYVKGEDVTAFFTIVQDIKVDPEEDRIGLLRVRMIYLFYFLFCFFCFFRLVPPI
jgi:hypothetical protein